MNMMYLIIWLNSAMVVIPEVYPEAQCESIVKDLKGFTKVGFCIPAPRINIVGGGGLQDYKYEMKPRICEGDCMKGRP